MVRLVKEWQDHSVSGWYGLTMDSGKIVNIWGRFRPPNHPQVYIYHESNAKSDHLLKVHFQIHLTFLLLRNVWLSSFLNHLIHFAFFADFTIEAFALCAFPYSINCMREICPFTPIFQVTIISEWNLWKVLSLSIYIWRQVENRQQQLKSQSKF